MEDIVTIGGTKGPGKTQALIGESLRDIYHPKYHGIFFRRVYPSLQEVVDRAHDLFPKVGGKWSGDLHRYTFPSGSKIDFSHIQNEEDKRKHQGKEYTKQFWDQLEEFTETQFDYVSTQNRVSAAGLRSQIWASHNPGGPGHAWVNRRFVKGKESGKTYFETVKLPDGRSATRTVCFIRGALADNKILMKNDPTYQAKLMMLPPKLRRAFLDGDYDILEGQFFEEWREIEHVIPPFEVGPEFKIYMSLDWGYSKPLSCHWWAVPPDMRHVYCIGEYYVTQVQSHVAAEEIHEINRKRFGEDYISQRRIDCMFVDPSVASTRGHTGKPIAEEFQRVMSQELGGRTYQQTIYPADNDRLAGWDVFRRMLSIQPDGKPFCQWFSTCENAIRTIPEQVHDEIRPEDLDTDGEDHAADDHRYFFIMRFGGKKMPVPDPYQKLLDAGDVASHDEWAAVAKRRKERYSSGGGIANDLARIGE